ncbi:MAG: DNA repair protein RecO [Methylococcales bacterium]|nr:DNA repair protein RecO [Methylococcales bacterium]
MTDNLVYLQPAFILQQRKFKETSLIIDVLTRDFGRLSLIAKGVRKAKSKTAGLLQPFIPLLVSYWDKSELKILTGVEMAKPPVALQGLGLYCGFYVNELVGSFLHPHDPHPEVFGLYGDCLSRLSKNTIETALRLFELDLLDAVGYGLQLGFDAYSGNAIEPLAKYHFDGELGPIKAPDGPFAGTTLLALSVRDFSDAQVLVEAKQLMRPVISRCLQGKPLRSRAVINNIIKYL